MLKKCCRQTLAKSAPIKSLSSTRFLTALALAATFSLPFLSGCVRPIGIVSRPVNFGPTALNTTRHTLVTTVPTGDASGSRLRIQLTGDPSFRIQSKVSCHQNLPAGSACPIELAFHPTTPGQKTATLRLTLTGPNPSSATFHIAGNGVSLAPGQGMVESTDNPLVALYAFQPTGPGKVYVSFGTHAPHGRKTWAVPTPANGDPVSIYVAGMRANTTYHLQATENLSSGGTLHDLVHTFATSNFPRSILPRFSVTTPAGTTPQPGIELISASYSDVNGYLQAYATDLKGHIIWGYNYRDRIHRLPSNGILDHTNLLHRFATIVQPVKLLPNGHMILVLSYPTQQILRQNNQLLPQPPGITDLIREINLAGDPIRQITLNQLNTELSAAGYHIHLYDFSHDVTVLPNGHWLVLADTIRPEAGLKGEPSPINVIGDVIVDLNPHLKPVWVWNEFDHLNLNRHPMDFPDWTHTNAIVYSPSDGNLLVSIRHQHWIVKVNYDHGKGNGKILWRLGYQGDFKLRNGSSPIDWFYAQHDPSFVGPSTPGNFNLTMMDNGDDRLNASGQKCGSSSFPCYSTVPIFNVNTSTRTATLKFNYKLPSSQYNSWGGNAEILPNGDLEFDLCGEPMTPSESFTSTVEEITPTRTPRLIWKMQEFGANLYRAKRIPSLYPGIQW